MSRRAMVVVELDERGDAVFTRILCRGRERSVVVVSTDGDDVQALDDDVTDETLTETNAVAAHALRALASKLCGA